jgi:hypothetical protein
MFETEGLKVKLQVPVFDSPLLRQVEKLPFAAAFTASVIMGIQLPP